MRTFRGPPLARRGTLFIPVNLACWMMAAATLAPAEIADWAGTPDARPARDAGRPVAVAIPLACGGGIQYRAVGGPERASHPAGRDAIVRDGPASRYGCDDGSVVDLMLVYTPAARLAAGGIPSIEALLSQAVAETNAALTRSLVNLQINLVHTREMPYDETGQWEVDGPRLVGLEDGYLDGVHALRDEHGADCVGLVVNTLNAGGIGYFPDPSLTGIGASGFHLLRVSSLPHVLAHELGHNLFCAHDRPNAPDLPWAEYSYGYVEPGQAWQTIMAASPTAYIQYFANPAVFWPGPVPPNPGPTGIPQGQPNPCDVARTINETRLFAANFRPSRVYGLPSVLYVDAEAPVGGDGTSWTAALRRVDEALCLAARSGGSVQQVWVAGGTYLPTGDGRYATFRLVQNVAVYGGFAGTETTLQQRDPAGNLTVLSGDIGAPSDNSDNCYHVITVAPRVANAVVDGFVITGGRADGPPPDDGGAGVLVTGSGAARLVRCKVVQNTALNFGGGIYAGGGGTVVLEDCAIEQNAALAVDWPAGGGGLYAYEGGHFTLERCTLTANTAQRGAGMALLFDCDPVLKDCTLRDHVSAVEGGAVYAYAGCDPQIDGGLISGNEADFGGALALFFDCLPVLNSVIFRSNTAQDEGGAAYLYSASSAKFHNGVFTGNAALGGVGGAVMVLFGSDATLVNCTLTGNTAGALAGAVYSHQSAPALFNSLLWQNLGGGSAGEAGQFFDDDGLVTLANCTVEGWTNTYGGSQNNGSNPGFVDANGADNIFGTPDDDLHLSPGGPAIDTGDNAALPVSLLTDVEGRRRVVAGVVDRGAYEYALYQDLNGDGAVGFSDAVLLWNCLGGPQAPPVPEECLLGCDLDRDGDVDLHDVALFGSW